MSAERRINARRILYSPEYLDMGEDNGGVVVNLSEGGLGFHAVGPVIPDVEIPVSFSLGPGYRIDVKARVVWVGDHGKIGGAVFGKLSKDSRSLIREWLAKPEVERDAENEAERRTPEGISATDTLPLPAPAMPPQQMPANPSAAAVTATPHETPENGVVLPSLDVQLPAELSPAASFPAHEIAPPPAPLESEPIAESVAPQPVAQNLPQPTQDSLSQEVRATQTDAPEVISKRSETPVRSARPEAPAPEPAREQPRGPSFSAVPSISAWNKSQASAGRSPLSQPKTTGAVFPPRNAENIFARSPSQAEVESGGRKGSTLLVIAIVIAAGAIIAFYARGHRQQIGNTIVHIGNSVAGTSAANATEAPTPAKANPAPMAPSSTSAAPPPSSVSSATANHTPAATPPDTTAKSTPTLPAAPVATQNGSAAGNVTQPESATPQTPRPVKSAKSQPVPNASHPSSAVGATSPTPPYSGQAEYQRAENYLNGKGVDKDASQAAEWFWRSLEAGNTTAAIPLADLYLAGNGVSRSCTQARILLDAAAQKNNQEAIQKLAELPESCQ